MSIGLSNSRCGDTSGTRPSVKEAGIDTARFLFRVWDQGQQDRAETMCGERPMDLGGLRAGYMASHELLWVEGRPVQAVKGRGETALLPAEGLGDAHEATRRMLRDVAGLTDTRPVGVARLDVTATIQLDRPADGWAMLRGLGALDAPRRKAAVYLDATGRRPETVNWITERGSIRERAYDKGVEAGIAPAGHLIRLEAQTRHPKATRTTVGAWTMERVAETFESRFAPMAKAADGVRVCSETALREQLREYVTTGKITARQAELLLGHLAAQSVGIPTPRRTAFRRRAELRRLGLLHALDGDDGQATDVDLGAVLADALRPEVWR